MGMISAWWTRRSIRAIALPALGKMVGQSLNGKLVVILWNLGAGLPAFCLCVFLLRSGCWTKDRRISILTDSEQRQIPHNIEHDTAFFIPAGDDLEQEVGGARVEGQIPDL